MGNFGDLTNIEDFEKRNNFKDERGIITFYCKNCSKIVEINRPNKNGYVFICKDCGMDKIALGTEEGIREKYKLN